VGSAVDFLTSAASCGLPKSVKTFALPFAGSLSRPSGSKRNVTEGIAMKLPQTGGCQWGKIRYEITEAPQLVYSCHCTDCQRLTSGAFSLGIVIAESAFRLSGIEPRPLQRIADSGRTKFRFPRRRGRLTGASTAADEKAGPSRLRGDRTLAAQDLGGCSSCCPLADCGLAAGRE
jgi:glutathione-dependent formaldehyde-activating enzyme